MSSRLRCNTAHHAPNPNIYIYTLTGDKEKNTPAMDYTKLLTGCSGDGARSTTKELSDRCSTQIKAHRRYPLDLPSKNEVQIKEALRRICDGDTYRAVASSHFQSMVQTYALEAYKINKTGDLQIRWTQVKEYLLQHPWESPDDTYPKTSTWWNTKKGERKKNRLSHRIFAERCRS